MDVLKKNFEERLARDFMPNSSLFLFFFLTLSLKIDDQRKELAGRFPFSFAFICIFLPLSLASLVGGGVCLSLSVCWHHGKTLPTILGKSEGIYKNSSSLMKTNALLCSVNPRQKLEFNLQAAWADSCLPWRWITSTVFQKSILCQVRPSQSIWNYPMTHSTQLKCHRHRGALSLFLRYSPWSWNETLNSTVKSRLYFEFVCSCGLLKILIAFFFFLKSSFDLLPSFFLYYFISHYVFLWNCVEVDLPGWHLEVRG